MGYLLWNTNAVTPTMTAITTMTAAVAPPIVTAGTHMVIIKCIDIFYFGRQKFKLLREDWQMRAKDSGYKCGRSS